MSLSAHPGVRSIALLVGLAFLGSCGDPAAADPSGTRFLVLEHAQLIDGRSSAVRPDMTVIVDGTDIRNVVAGVPASIPDSALVIDLHGQWLLPGLVDSHVHISHESRRAMEATLERAVRGGVTTVRDMGGDARRLAALQRDAMLGEIFAPDIVYSAIFAGEKFFTDPRVLDTTRGATPGEVAWMRAVRPSTDVDEAVLLAKGAGASAVKIYADLPPAEVARVTAAAHRHGLKSWSHATVFPSRPSDAVRAGVDVISHASMLQWEVLKDVPPYYGAHRDVKPLDPAGAASPRLGALFAEMKRRGTILDATLFVGKEVAEAATDSTRRIALEGLQAFAVAATRAAHAAGVKVSAGTDDLIGETSDVPNLHEELRLLVSAGFTPMEALQAATRVSAEAAGVLDRVGTIEPGKRANLLVLGSDPTARIESSTDIRLVVKAGRLVVGP